MKLYSYWRSSAAYRVRIALGLKSLPYEYVAVDLLRDGGDQRRAEYLRLNPGGRVPTLVVDGQAIVQSMAILEWLDERFPAIPLLPADAFQRARVRGLAQMIVADIQPLQNLSVTEYLRNEGGWPPERVSAWLRRWVGAGLAAVEQSLQESAQASPSSGGSFCVGDMPTLADACLVPQCYAARRFGVDPAGFPRIAAIEARCLELEAFAAAVPERQPDAPPGGA
jgi:maleylacetoacetate isomerase